MTVGSKNAGRFAGTEAVRPQHSIDAGRLEQWLHDHVPEIRSPITITQFKGGQSNPTYKIAAANGNYVVRRKPPGQLLKSAHAVDREFRILSVLSDSGFPVARPLALCTDESVIGTIFYVMEFVEGRIFWETTIADVPREQRAHYFDAMNRTIADLHNLDPIALGLENFGRIGNYLERQIDRWTQQYQADSAAGRSAAMERLVEWLPRNIPCHQETRIVHGDFRCDNLIFDPVEPKVIAVLDWELATLGDPLADFAYHAAMYRVKDKPYSGLLGQDLEALNIPTEVEYVAQYARYRSLGRQLDDLDFYVAFGLFRLAAISHGIKGRVIRGTAASPHAAVLAEAVDEIAELAWAQVKGKS